jgi:hypothetical protein
MMWIVLLGLLWSAVGIGGGGLVFLTMFDMDVEGAAFVVFLGAIGGPLFVLAGLVTLGGEVAPKKILIKSFRARKELR